MNIPTNCRECEYYYTCENAAYGIGLCKHKEAIEQRTIDATPFRKDKDLISHHILKLGRAEMSYLILKYII